jgi:hypothetical protein
MNNKKNLAEPEKWSNAWWKQLLKPQINKPPKKAQ